ncbi:acylphosphatase-2-like [Bolinopsis microptera]|uniref:acylphosphatase-2-like n=1 Tax=Bolinopsis microptera TaxID=2820187 RepID=UPI00307AF580
MSNYRSIDFKVFGRVQGVFFRKFTKEQADKLKLVGWCKNEPDKTVIGVAQGLSPAIDTMKSWLNKTGSPQSRIDSCSFSNDRSVEKMEFGEFAIRRKRK